MERLASKFNLIEGPTWEPGGTLLFSDAKGGGLWRLLADGSVEDVVPHRKGIGGVALHADGGQIVSGRSVTWKRPNGESVVLFDRRDENMSFNDLCADPDGRIYVGSLEFDPLSSDSHKPSGELYLIDLDGSVRVVASDVKLTNGLGVSPDGATLYHADTNANAVWQYDRAIDGGLTDRRPLFQQEGKDPDGIAIAADGSVWVAMAHSGEVLGIDPSGKVIATIEVEVPIVTSVCFGGTGLKDLYIVTGSEDAPADLGGAVYRMPAPTPGLPAPVARVKSGAGA